MGRTGNKQEKKTQEKTEGNTSPPKWETVLFSFSNTMVKHGNWPKHNY